MARKVRSARGVMVDFDLPKIKSQILKTPKTDDIKKRERFIDKKRRRTSTNTVDQLLAQQINAIKVVEPAKLIEQAKEAMTILNKPEAPVPEDPHKEDIETIKIEPIVKK